MKIPLFCLCWLVVAFYVVTSKDEHAIPGRLILYVLTMILLPILSIAYYAFTNGREPYDGYQFLKSYLFISFALILYIARIHLVKYLSAVLTVLSVSIIGVYIAVLFEPSVFTPIFEFGHTYGLIALGKREYSDDYRSLAAFFVTSPMLAISVSYYVAMTLRSQGALRIMYGVASMINIAGMFMAGTRNNMLVSICLPLAILYWQSKNRQLTAIFVMGVLVLVVGLFSPEISAMLSSTEISNEIKIAYLSDYHEIFKEPVTVLFGQGLGAYQYWHVLGEDTSIVELTYLEIIRNYGIVSGTVLIYLLIYPVTHAVWINNREKTYIPILIGYVFYLFMSITNPFIFSSLGMLILSTLIADVFIFQSEYRSRTMHGTIAAPCSAGM
ncbi:MAG: hypothetical protein ACYC7L_10085 [Nitrospirota bacterium]